MWLVDVGITQTLQIAGRIENDTKKGEKGKILQKACFTMKSNGFCNMRNSKINSMVQSRIMEKGNEEGVVHETF